MKKITLLKDFIFGGTIFTISIVFSIYLSLLFGKETNSLILDIQIKGYIIFFVFGGCVFSIMKSLFGRINIKQRKNLIRNQLVLYGIFLCITVVIEIVSVLKNDMFMSILVGGFLFAISISEIGLFIANKILKKDIQLINNKLKENK